MYGSESSSDGGWISWFIELEGHEFFVEVSISLVAHVPRLIWHLFEQVDVEYIRDSFNLYGLKERVPHKYK